MRTYVGSNASRISIAPLCCFEPAWKRASALNTLEKEGIVQRFEYCFELAWKTIKDYLEAGGMVFGIITPRQVLKDAFAAKILADGHVWIDMLDHRNLLFDTYSQTSFEQAVEAIDRRYLAALGRLDEFSPR